MTDIATLIARLEAATAGSRELDSAISRAVGDVTAIELCTDHGRIVGCPAFTASIDAALALVPEGKDWTVRSCAVMAEVDIGEDEWISVNAATPALALCIAALRVRIQAAQERSDGPGRHDHQQVPWCNLVHGFVDLLR